MIPTCFLHSEFEVKWALYLLEDAFIELTGRSMLCMSSKRTHSERISALDPIRDRFNSITFSSSISISETPLQTLNIYRVPIDRRCPVIIACSNLLVSQSLIDFIFLHFTTQCEVKTVNFIKVSKLAKKASVVLCYLPSRSHA